MEIEENLSVQRVARSNNVDSLQVAVGKEDGDTVYFNVQCHAGHVCRWAGSTLKDETALVQQISLGYRLEPIVLLLAYRTDLSAGRKEWCRVLFTAK
jgi:hypothetical protein